MSVNVSSTVTDSRYDEENHVVLNLSIRVRRKTREEWISANTANDRIPVGELCYATDTGELRVGTYRNLEYKVPSISTTNDNLYNWIELPNVLGIDNQIKLNADDGNRYLCIDDGDLDI